MTQLNQSVSNLKKSAIYFQNGDIEKSVSFATQAIEKSPSSAEVFHNASLILIGSHANEELMDLLPLVLKHQGESGYIYFVMGQLSSKMGLMPTAVKAFERACALTPDDPDILLQYAIALEKSGRTDDAMGLLQTALESFPQTASLWNALGNMVYNYKADYHTCVLFLQEALKLEPDNSTYLYNYALRLNFEPEAEEYFSKSLKAEPDNAQINVSYAIYLFAIDRFKDAWPHYKYRHDPSLGAKNAFILDLEIPEHVGEDLTDKSIFIVPEQGIGDEVLYAAFINKLSEACSQIYIGCDPRLVDIYNRSFPFAEAFAFEDTIEFGKRMRKFPQLEAKLLKTGLNVDHYLYLADLAALYIEKKEDFLNFPGGYLKPKPEMIKSFKKRFEKLQKPLIGISWSSGNLSDGRAMHYYSPDIYEESFLKYEATYIPLQYTMNEECHAYLGEFDATYFLNGIDLKQDIEANLAIASLINVSIGPNTATQIFAMATGCSVILRERGYPWPYHFTNSQTYFMGSPVYFEHVKYYKPVVETLTEYFHKLL